MTSVYIVGQVATIIAVAAVGGAILLALWHLYQDARAAMQAFTEKTLTEEACLSVLLDEWIFGAEGAPPQAIVWPEIPETLQ